MRQSEKVTVYCRFIIHLSSTQLLDFANCISGGAFQAASVMGGCSSRSL